MGAHKHAGGLGGAGDTRVSLMAPALIGRVH